MKRALMLIGLAACGGGAQATWIEQSKAAGAFVSVAGTGPSDLWLSGNFSSLSHWDGAAWHDVTFPTAHPGAMSGLELYAVSPGHVLVDEVNKLTLVDASGQLTDFAPSDLKGRTDVVYTLGGGRNLVLVASSNAVVLSAYWLDNQQWTPLSPPPRTDVRAVMAYAKDDIIGQGQGPMGPVNLFPPVTSFAATDYVHFDGTAWSEIVTEPLEPVFVGASSPSIPAEKRVFGSYYFDGARFHALQLPPPSGYLFWTKQGTFGNIVRVAGRFDATQVYDTQIQSNGETVLIPIDAPTYTETTMRRFELDGTQWRDVGAIGTAEVCGGCPYGGFGGGVAGELLDGTIVVFIGKDPQGKAGLFLVKP